MRKLEQLRSARAAVGYTTASVYGVLLVIALGAWRDTVHPRGMQVFVILALVVAGSAALTILNHMIDTIEHRLDERER